jgi:hypothetical protein
MGPIRHSREIETRKPPDKYLRRRSPEASTQHGRLRQRGMCALLSTCNAVAKPFLSIPRSQIADKQPRRPTLMSPISKKPSGVPIIRVSWRSKDRLTQMTCCGVLHVLEMRGGRRWAIIFAESHDTWRRLCMYISTRLGSKDVVKSWSLISDIAERWTM